ncbi:hypothetical protein AVEN_214852-1 [Araneus ventricosus]|uniref:Uncharacterized protein n=1 Tax=Araneus ventricosus TaxID=182803 RepID=A0A4Y2T3C9_ARAVE|nr:hypothetical protein AVEN_16481-1 [Araneus ventricosus]GBN94420.1 hypothetical protein AVEN_145440-1 [Araneus ventricosus]GBN94423.1 hypothetical protein AVEN_157999-1 [Araneus ventricosus]GBN94430.1 hypothetical protein AVEN_214852-1 [Araneus ventricosus]
MDTLRYSEVQKIIFQTRRTINIDDKAEYLWCQAHSLYLVGSAGCRYHGLIQRNETLAGEHCSATIDETEPSNEAKRDKLGDKT